MVSRQALICVFLGFICPPLGMIASLICIHRDFDSWRAYIAVIALTMGVFAYHYEPTVQCDLLRYFGLVEKMTGHTYSEALEIADQTGLIGHDPLYSFIALCWIVSKTGNVHWLPFVATTSVYYIGMYITCRCSEDLTENRQEAVEYLYFILLAVNFFSIVNNVRNMLSFTLIALAVFRDCHLRKRNPLTYTLYAFGVYMHLSGIILIAFRILIPLVKKMRLPLLIIGLAVPNAITHLAPVLNRIQTGSTLLRRFISLVNSGYLYYTHVDADWAITVANSGAQKLFKIFYLSSAAAIVVIYYILIHVLKTREDESLREKYRHTSMIDFTYFCAVLAIACGPMVMPEYWRFGCMAILCGAGLYVLLPLLSRGYGRFVQRMYLVFGCCMFVLWFRNLWMYSNVPIGLARSLLFGPLPSVVLAPFDITAFNML